jgi:hypothetical protein
MQYAVEGGGGGWDREGGVPSNLLKDQLTP